MAHEYDVLLNDGDHAAVAFENDYRGIAPLLASCRGRVADIGGGVGVTRHWLSRDAHYVLVEPSEIWRDQRWRRHAARFPCLLEPPRSVRALAEALPFGAASFDVLLYLWSLNHVCDVAQCLREATRVLRPGGRVIAVLEDMQPGAALQPDHVAVDARQLTELPRTRVVSHDWFAGYLILQLQRSR
jgi:ubiquinone/menaquinone biosynthesis C-methylase UbiE